MESKSFWVFSFDFIYVTHIILVYYIYHYTMEALNKTLNVRLSQSTHNRLKALTESTGRSQSWLAVEALEAYLEQQSWQIAEVTAGMAEADRGEFASTTNMQSIFAKYAN